MTLIFTEPFDIYNTITNFTGIGGWAFGGNFATNGSATIGTGRFAGQALNLTQGNSSPGGAGYRQTLSGSFATLIGGVAFKTAGTPIGEGLFGFDDSGTIQLDVRFNSSGQLTVTRNATVLVTSTQTILANIWYYLELKATFHSSAGSYAVRLNGATVAGIPDAINVNTSATGTASANQVHVGFGIQAVNPQGLNFDDLYVCSTAGSVNNDFLGDVELRTLLPNNVGSNSGFTRTGGSVSGNYTAVNENPNDGDTSYVSSSVAGTVDTYLYPSLPATTASIFAVVSNQVARKDDAGARHVTTRLHMAGGSEADFTAADLNLSASYQMARQIQETNPVTSTTWATSDINGGEFGPKVSA